MKHQLFWVWSVVMVSLLASCHSAQKDITNDALIPYPTTVEDGVGSFVITADLKLAADLVFENAAAELQREFTRCLGRSLQMVADPNEASIVFQKNDSIATPEGYHLSVTADKVVLTAATPEGMFHATETLRQLFPPVLEQEDTLVKDFIIPVMEINDAPAFAWRGVHLDVSRHFFSIEYIQKLIDRMALYKLNKLHLHLTDDQGWRIEIKAYPELTEQGAWRTFDKNDSSCMEKSVENPDMAIDQSHITQRNGKTVYGGYYTQQELKDLVAYAAARYIDIVPEIDMPGHMMAAIHAFPELSCVGGSTWGELFSTPICPCKESTYTFAENVFKEVMDIFPSEYIHLGADEVDRKTWEESAVCKELMKSEGLKTSAELQSYFVKRMEQFFHEHGRKLIGWDEILEGGISPTANVMYWRSWVKGAPVEAARHGNHVVMCPVNGFYFDNEPGPNSLRQIYEFHVISDELTEAQSKFIIGAQANLWTERVPSENRADYLYFPRLLALSELVWSNAPDYGAFESRLPMHYKRLEALGVHYRLPDLSGFTADNVFVDQAVLDVKKVLPELTLHYTTDGSLPASTSPTLEGPLTIKEPATIKLAAFSPSGNRGEIYTLTYKQESYQEASAVASTTEGLSCTYYEKYLKNTHGMENAQPDSQFVAANIVVPKSIQAPSFGLQYDGYLNIPETGVYSFYLLCDDGGLLNIGDKEVVNNDGQHSAIEKSGQVALEKGLHPFHLGFLEAGGGYTLRLRYCPANAEPEDVPDNFFMH